MRARTRKRITAIAVCLAAVATVFLCAFIAAFPNKYASEIDAAADEFGLERALVRALVRAESGFDKDAVSDKGATGLMQLMPKTLDYCAKRLNIDPDGFDPVTSLRCGCLYLSELLREFGDERAALYAYNAGPTNARAHLNGAPAFPETAAYIERVLRGKRVYELFT